ADPTIGVQALYRSRLIDSRGDRYYEAAIPTTGGSKEFVIPFDATKFLPTNEDTFTGVAITNIDSLNSSTVTCIARDSSGAVIPNAVVLPKNGQLNPNGHWADFNFPLLAGRRGS